MNKLKISDVIRILQGLQEEYGDLPVTGIFEDDEYQMCEDDIQYIGIDRFVPYDRILISI